MRFVNKLLRYAKAKQIFFSPMTMVSLMALFLLPSYFILQQHQRSSLELQNFEKELIRLEGMAKLTKQKQYRHERFLREYHRADPAYIEKHLVSHILLQSDLNVLTQIHEHEAYQYYRPIKERLTALSNHLAFVEKVKRAKKPYEEIELELKHPVEIDQKDLNQILSSAEGIQIGHHLPAPHRPQIIITKFALSKNNLTENKQTYNLDISLLQRIAHEDS